MQLWISQQQHYELRCDQVLLVFVSAFSRLNIKQLDAVKKRKQLLSEGQLQRLLRAIQNSLHVQYESFTVNLSSVFFFLLQFYFLCLKLFMTL